MHTGVILHPMGGSFCEFSLNIRGRNIPIMANKAVILLNGMVQKPLRPACCVGPVAVFTSIFSYGNILGLRPWVRTLAIPPSTGCGMRTCRPALLPMADRAEVCIYIRHNEEPTIVVIVRVMTCRTLELSVLVKPYLVGKA